MSVVDEFNAAASKAEKIVNDLGTFAADGQTIKTMAQSAKDLEDKVAGLDPSATVLNAKADKGGSEKTQAEQDDAIDFLTLALKKTQYEGAVGIPTNSNSMHFSVEHSTMWQDTAKTTPAVSAGDSVRVITDTLRGIDAIVTTEGAPPLEVDENGELYLNMGGDGFFIADPDISGENLFIYADFLTRSVVGGDQVIFGNSGTGNLNLYVETGNDTIRSSYGSWGSPAGIESSTILENVRYRAFRTYDNGINKMFIDGGVTSKVGVAPTPLHLGDIGLGYRHRNGVSEIENDQNLNGRLYEFFISTNAVADSLATLASQNEKIWLHLPANLSGEANAGDGSSAVAQPILAIDASNPANLYEDISQTTLAAVGGAVVDLDGVSLASGATGAVRSSVSLANSVEFKSNTKYPLMLNASDFPEGVVIMVALSLKAGDHTGIKHIIQSQNNNNALYLDGNSIKSKWVVGGSDKRVEFDTSSWLLDEQPFVLTMTVNKTKRELRINGFVVDTDAGADGDFINSDTALGGNTGDSWLGELGALLIFNKIESEEELNRQEYEMAKKIGAVHALDRAKTFEVSAHRGNASGYVEQTIKAYSPNVVGNPTTFNGFVEFDIVLSSDGVWFLNHNNNPSSVTGGVYTEGMSTYTAAQIHAMVTSDNQRILSLAEMLRHAKTNNFKCYIEFKVIPTSSQIEDVLSQIRETIGIEKVIIQSFNEGIIDAVRAIDPEVELSYLHEGFSESFVDQVAQKPGKNRTFSKYINYDNADRHRISYFIDAGIPLDLYTVNNSNAIAQFMNMGVSGITTDTNFTPKYDVDIYLKSPSWLTRATK